MTTLTADISDRATYRRGLDRAAQGGLRVFSRYLNKHSYLFAPQEWTRVLKMLDHLGSNLARLTHQKFLSLHGQPHDPQIDGGDYPTVIEVLITPHRFIRHALFVSGGSR